MHKTIGTLFVASMTLGLTACPIPTKATGGGRIDSTATFGFNGNSCDGEVQGRFTLVDKTHDPQVRLRGEVVSALACPSPGCVCDPGEIQINATYTSNNNAARGTGNLVACLDDNGEGQDAVDTAYVEITSGPFTGYTVEGEVTGNVQEHGCD